MPPDTTACARSRDQDGPGTGVIKARGRGMTATGAMPLAGVTRPFPVQAIAKIPMGGGLDRSPGFSEAKNGHRRATRPRLLDAYCGAGGAARGYQLAGFDVTGVDIAPQPCYIGDAFHQGDAIEFIRAHGHEFDAIHASSPCQSYTPLNAYNKLEYPDLVVATREALRDTGHPWVIENVLQAPLINPIRLCGPMFGLRLYRDRGFESSVRVLQPIHKPHDVLCSRNGYLPTLERPYMSVHGGKHSRAWQATAAEYMGVPWMVAAPGMAALATGIRALCESIPPRYTKYVGDCLMAAVKERAA